MGGNQPRSETLKLPEGATNGVGSGLVLDKQ
jgi:hypothetical protein